MMFDFDSLELVVIVFSVISCLFSALVIITYLVFKDMQEKIFMKFIFYISLSDFCMNVTSTFGFPENGSALCYIQGISHVYFGLASWFWTTTLAYTIFCLISYGKIIIKLWQAYLICCMLPLLLAVLPFSTNSYGNTFCSSNNFI
jgi:hypothetical protein